VANHITRKLSGTANSLLGSATLHNFSKLLSAPYLGVRLPKHMDELIEFTVKGKFQLYESAENPRRSLGSSAYRPNHQFEGQKDFFIGFVEFENGECFPNKTVAAEIHVICSKKKLDHFKSGCQWLVFEGNQLVGKVVADSIEQVT
jgi:hypothetical protein